MPKQTKFPVDSWVPALTLRKLALSCLQFVHPRVKIKTRNRFAEATSGLTDSGWGKFAGHYASKKRSKQRLGHPWPKINGAAHSLQELLGWPTTPQYEVNGIPFQLGEDFPVAMRVTQATPRAAWDRLTRAITSPPWEKSSGQLASSKQRKNCLDRRDYDENFPVPREDEFLYPLYVTHPSPTLHVDGEPCWFWYGKPEMIDSDHGPFAHVCAEFPNGAEK